MPVPNVYPTWCEMLSYNPVHKPVGSTCYKPGIPSYFQKDICTKGNASTKCYDYSKTFDPSRLTYATCR